MRLYDFEVPFEDEALESRAWEHYELARDQGSHLSEGDLIRNCREMAHREVDELEKLGDEPAPLATVDEEGAD